MHEYRSLKALGATRVSQARDQCKAKNSGVSGGQNELIPTRIPLSYGKPLRAWRVTCNAFAKRWPSLCRNGWREDLQR